MAVCINVLWFWLNATHNRRIVEELEGAASNRDYGVTGEPCSFSLRSHYFPSISPPPPPVHGGGGVEAATKHFTTTTTTGGVGGPSFLLLPMFYNSQVQLKGCNTP